MTLKQKRIIAALVIVNSVVILALVVLVTRLSSPPSTSTSRSDVESYPSDMLTRQACQQNAAQLLAQAGLGGVVSLTPDELRFEIVYPLTPEQPPDEAAQQVWTAFDISLALMENQCDTFSRIEITILARGSRGDARIEARVNVADLEAFSDHKLSEKAFIERVSYTTDHVDKP